MRKLFMLAIAIGLISTGSLKGQACDDFNRPDSTVVSGWIEQNGDWLVSGNTLHAPTASTWNYITYGGSNQADGCITARVTYTGSPQILFVGLTARYSSSLSNIMVKLQDNTSAGYWTNFYIYCDNSSINYNPTAINFGKDANIQLEYIGVSCPEISLHNFAN